MDACTGLIHGGRNSNVNGMRILQITPRVPPSVCGVGDYAWLLAQALRDGHNIQSSFLSAGTTLTKPVGTTEFPVFRLPELTADALVDFITSATGEFEAVVLHMSPYGYQKRGMPLWLAAAWRRLSQTTNHPRLLTMFHELYATGSVSSSAFWLQPLQKSVLRSVAHKSDGLRTNREEYAVWLRQIPGLKNEVTVLPVFSNLGEPERLPSYQSREPRMVMFSSGMHGGNDAKATIRKVAKLAKRLGMQELHVVGGKFFDHKDNDLKVLAHSYMPAADISELLISARMAFTEYHPQFLAKSGVLAGYAAHSLAVVTAATVSELPDGLAAGRELLSLKDCMAHSALDKIDIESIGACLHRWYEGHSLAATAASYARQLNFSL